MLKIILFLSVFLLPQVVFAEDATSSKEVALRNSVAKLKESIKQERASTPVKVSKGVTDWSLAADTADTQPNGFTMLKGLSLCLGVFLIGISILRKIHDKGGGLKGAARKVRIIEKTQVTTKTTLILAEYAGREILFTVGNEQVSFCPEKAPERTEVLGVGSADTFAEIFDDENVRLSA